MSRGKRGTHTFNHLEYHKTHYVRVALDVKIPEYNALADYAKQQGKAINGLLREWMAEKIPEEIIEAHKNDIEKRRQ